MNTLKRLGLAILFIPLLFNAGFDTMRFFKARQVEGFVAEKLSGIKGISKVNVYRCYDIRYQFWLCDVEVQAAGGETARNVIPVPYEAVEKK